jgi:uncharacterized protein
MAKSMDIIKEVEEIVRQACAGDSNIFGYGIWTHHITQVANNAEQLAPSFRADPEIVRLAALLHDYASVKDKTLYQEHHIHGPLEAEKILRHFDYPQGKIEAVKHCIESHRASVTNEMRTAEAECLANADAMSHIQNVPSLLHLAFVQHNMDIDEGTVWVKNKLQRSWSKLSPPVRHVMRQKYESALLTLTIARRED